MVLLAPCCKSFSRMRLHELVIFLGFWFLSMIFTLCNIPPNWREPVRIFFGTFPTWFGSPTCDRYATTIFMGTYWVMPGQTLFIFVTENRGMYRNVTNKDRFLGMMICGAWNFKFHAPQIIMPKGPHSHLEHPHNSVHGSSFHSFLWQLLTRCPGAGIRLADRSSDLGATWVTFLSGLETYWGAEYVYWYWCAVIRDYDGYWSSQADLVSMWCHASRSSWSWWMSFDK